jgi:hypothetical protein
MTLKRTFLKFFTLIIVMFVIAGTANAQGDKAKEGVNYDLVEGPNSDWTYAKIRRNANINTDSLVAQLKTDMQSLRQDNPRKTLALCRKVKANGSEGYIGMNFPRHASEAQIIELRASNAPWEGCKDADQYTYLIPGETLVHKGVKHLSFSQKQAKVDELKACTDANCAIQAAKALTPNVDWSEVGSQELAAVPPMSTPTDGSIPPEADDKSQGAVVPPVAPPKGVSQAKGTVAPPPPPVMVQSKMDWPFWIMGGLLGLAGILLLVQTMRLGRAKATLGVVGADESSAQDAEAEIATLNHQLGQKERELASAASALESSKEKMASLKKSIAFHLKEYCKTLLGMAYETGNKEPADAMEEVLSYVRTWARSIQQAITDLRREIDPSSTAIAVGDILTPNFLEDTRLAAVEFRNSQGGASKTALAVQERAVQAKDQAVQDLNELVDSVRNLLIELSAANDDSEESITINTEDATSVMYALRERLGRINGFFQDLSSKAHYMVTGEGRRTQHAPFDTTTLRELVDALQAQHDELHAVLTADGSREATMLPDTQSGRLAMACDTIREQTASIGRYSKNVNEQTAKAARLQGEVDELQEILGQSAVHQDPANRTRAVQSGDTLVPGTMGLDGSVTDVDLRDPLRITMFESLVDWLRTNHDHVVIPLKHISEVGVIVGLREIFVQRKFQYAAPNGELVTFSASVIHDDAIAWRDLESYGAKVGA